MSNKEVIIIGAGPSGVCTAVQLQRLLGHQNFHIYERSAGLGGVWFNNTYPGCAVDIPAHYYSYSFALKPDWPKLYPDRTHLYNYFHGVCEEYDILRRMTFNVECVGMTWDEDRCIWTVSFRETNNPTKTFQREATAVVCAVGKLDLPSIPKISGQESFAGHQMHSARWDHSVDVRGRDVIVLGNGASATQFVPVIAPEVKTLTQFVKSAHYIQERHNPTFSSSFKWCMRHIPLACRVYRWAWAIEYDLGFGAFFMTPDGAEKRKAVAQETWDYIEKAAPEKYKDILRPDYVVGCRRRVHSHTYLECLHDAKIELLKDDVVEVKPHSVVTRSGREFPADVIIYATGFRTQDWLWPMTIVGQDSIELHDLWEKRRGVQAYYGTMCDHFPNWFTLYGPNTASGHNSVIYQTECQVNLLCRLLKPVLNGQARSIAPTPDAQRKLNKWIHNRLPGLTFSSGCTSWYLDKHGHNTFVWPDYSYKYWLRTIRIRWGDMEVRYPKKHNFIGGETVHWPNICLSLSIVGVLGSVLVGSLRPESLSVQGPLSAVLQVVASAIPKIGV